MNKLKESLRTWLKKAEYILKVDTIYIFRGSFWMTIGFISTTAASFISLVVYGNLLPKETYGIYSYLLSLANTLSFLTLTGIGPSIVRAVARGEEEVIPYALKLQLKYNLLAIATIGAGALYYAIKGNMVYALALGIMSIALPVGTAYHMTEQILTGRKQFRALSIITSIISIGSALLTAATLLLTKNVLALICVYSFVSVFPNLVIYYWIVSGRRASPDQSSIAEMRHSALHITGAGLIGTLAAYIDKIVLYKVAGPIILAVYGFAIAGPERLKGLMKNWISISMPKLASRDTEEIGASFGKRVTLVVLSGSIIAGIYIVLSPLLFKYLLPKYIDSVLYSQVYALNLIVYPVLTYIGTIFYSQNMIRAIYISSTGNQVLRIVLFLFFGWKWHIWGLIIASLLTQVTSAIYCILVWEYERKRLRNIPS